MAVALLDTVRSKVTAGGGPQGMRSRLSWSLVVELLQLGSSMLVFFALTRLLTPEDFGVMGGVLAVAMPVASLSSIGSHAILIKRVSQGADVGDTWQRALSMGVWGPGIGALLVILAKPLILPAVNGWVYASLVIAQLNLFWITELAVFIGNGTRRIRDSAQIRLTVVSIRLAGLLLFALVGRGSLTWWAFTNLVTFGLGALMAIGYIWRYFGARPSLVRLSVGDMREGLPFAVNSVSESVVDVSDRPLLVRYGHGADAAIYTVAARIIQFGYLPLLVLLRASDADMFEAGRHGTRPTMRVLRRLLAPGVGVALLVAVGFLVLAPLVPVVAGSEYDDAVGAIRMLSVLPLIRCVQYLMGNCLSASGHQWWRVGATLSAAAVNFGLNVRFLPQGQWSTAVYTTITSEIYLTAVMAAMVFLLSTMERRQAAYTGRSAVT
ncbi:MAG: lipopolysaccharide biosynthesis protein [Acidimicrobiales bacterium]